MPRRHYRERALAVTLGHGVTLPGELGVEVLLATRWASRHEWIGPSMAWPI